MKIILIAIFAIVAFAQVQEFEAELPVEFQVIHTESAYDMALNYLKGLFVSTEENRSYPLYKQCDSRWANEMINTKTICQVGCLMSSMAEALTGHGKTINGGEINPHTFNEWLKKNGGYSGNSFVWGTATAPFSLNYLGQFGNPSSYVGENSIVILNVHNGGHWVLAKSYSNGVYQVNDPGYQTDSYTSSQVEVGAVYQRK